MKWLKHAFAVDPPGPAEPTSAQQPVVDYVCIQIARRQMSLPGIVFLEMSKPLNWIAAQTMHVFRPGVWTLLNHDRYESYIQFSEYLERRGSLEYLARRIEYFEEELTRLKKQGGNMKEYIDSYLVGREKEFTTEGDGEHGDERS